MASPYDKVPPHSIEAEQSVLGAIFIEAEALPKVTSLLRTSDFYRENHQILYDVAKTLADRGEPFDIVTVPNELRNRQQLDAVGGMAYLVSLFDTVPTATSVEYYAKIVQEKAVLRRLITASLETIEAAYGEVTDLPTLLKRAESRVERVTETAGKGKGGRYKPLRERMIDLADVEMPDDQLLMYGRYILKATAHWLTGQTGLGKSTFAFNLACALAEGTALWGIECEPTKILYCDMESGDVGRAHKVERLYRDAPRVRGSLTFLREPIRLPDELPELLKIVHEDSIDLVIFDTARRCFSVKDENDNAEVYRQIVPTLDALKQIGVASLTMGHPSKNGNGSARGAGAQEDAGDVNLTLTMHRGDINDQNGIIALRVTKNRLLGHVPPLFLRRIGEDQFAVDCGEEAGGVVPEVKIGAQARCSRDILKLLASLDRPLLHSGILTEMKVLGHKEGTAKHAITDLQKCGKIENPGEGYLLGEGYVPVDEDN